MSEELQTSDLVIALNSLSHDQLHDAVFQCCSSTTFAQSIVGAAPFASVDELSDAVRHAEATMGPDDWLEAFSHHPRIGDKTALAKKMEGSEQAGMQQASQRLVDRMYEANQEYENRFGHIYLVCATGKSAEELLSILEARLDNDPDVEFGIACAEQRKITNLRLENFLSSLTIA